MDGFTALISILFTKEGKMKKHLFKYKCVLLILCLLLLTLTGCPLWGSPGFDFAIENQTQQVLHISVNSGSEVEVKPGEKIIKNLLRDTGKYNIVAKNTKGDIVFSKELTLKELEDLNKKVIIR
jgi:hypothetical protein